MSTKYIRIDETRVKNNQTVVSKLSFSNNVKKYFQSSLFFAKYDVNIQNINSSILNIPIVANVIPIAWAIGADIFVEELDKTFLQSLDRIRTVMEKWYPQFSFSTRIHTKNRIVNNFPKERNALLFSGGLDSTCSYIKLKSKLPFLIMIWGADIPIAEKEFWEKVKQKYAQFAEVENTRLHVIKSNIRPLLNEKKIIDEFGTFCTQHSWWGAVQHGFSSLGLCAPLTEAERIGNLFIASSCSPDLLKSGKPWGSHPLIDNKLSWANIQVFHHDQNLGRQDKIRDLLKNYIKTHERYPALRVCYSQFRELNCGKCEKCLRTITGLVLENIDPNKCGFDIDKNFFSLLKKFFVKERFSLIANNKVGMWTDIQRHIPKTSTNNMYNSKEFFEWFRCFDFSEKFARKNPRYWLLLIFKRLPESVRKIIVRLSTVFHRVLKRNRALL